MARRYTSWGFAGAASILALIGVFLLSGWALKVLSLVGAVASAVLAFRVADRDPAQLRLALRAGIAWFAIGAILVVVNAIVAASQARGALASFEQAMAIGGIFGDLISLALCGPGLLIAAGLLKQDDPPEA